LEFFEKNDAGGLLRDGGRVFDIAEYAKATRLPVYSLVESIRTDALIVG
jgi:hypothetical protein